MPYTKYNKNLYEYFEGNKDEIVKGYDLDKETRYNPSDMTTYYIDFLRHHRITIRKCVGLPKFKDFIYALKDLKVDLRWYEGSKNTWLKHFSPFHK